ncbi:MAG TPA: hypothetical protein DCP02_03110 [Actinobacteria bacterium]|nr:hypothetical protein [Actinomycetota bacterium]
MSKTNIIILIICTAIFIVVIVSTLKPDPGIGEIYLVSSDSAVGISVEDKKISDFDTAAGIYLVIPVKDIKAGDTISTSWIQYAEDGQKIIQEDSIAVKNDGSGEIIVYFLKRDDAYYPGDYKAEVEYNNQEKAEAFFTINGP